MPLIMPFSLRRRVRTAPPYTFHQGQRIRGREHDLVVLGAESIRHEAREAPLVVAGSVETDGEGLDRRCIRLARRTRSHGARVNTATDKPPDRDVTAEPPSYRGPVPSELRRGARRDHERISRGHLHPVHDGAGVPPEAGGHKPGDATHFTFSLSSL